MIRKLSFLFEGGVIQVDCLSGVASWKYPSNARIGKIINVLREAGK